MALTCDRVKSRGSEQVACGKPAETELAATLRGREVSQDLCAECARDMEAELLQGGARVSGARVDYKPRAAYVAASGASFTAEEARPWLVERQLAGERGRLSKQQLQAYADTH